MMQCNRNIQDFKVDTWKNYSSSIGINIQNTLEAKINRGSQTE